MRYLILIHNNPAFQEVWDGLSDDQRVEFGRAHLALAEDLDESASGREDRGQDQRDTA